MAYKDSLNALINAARSENVVPLLRSWRLSARVYFVRILLLAALTVILSALLIFMGTVPAATIMAIIVSVAGAIFTLALVVVVFGFASGFALRLIVLAYPRSDPRRAELIAELYALPRIQRPLWVAEQLEVALFEGLRHRVSAATRGQGPTRAAQPEVAIPAELRQKRAMQTHKRGVRPTLGLWAGLLPGLIVAVLLVILGADRTGTWMMVLITGLTVVASASAELVALLATGWLRQHARLRRHVRLQSRPDRTR